MPDSKPKPSAEQHDLKRLDGHGETETNPAQESGESKPAQEAPEMQTPETEQARPDKITETPEAQVSQAPATAGATQSDTPPDSHKSERLQGIERLLEDGLDGLYWNLPAREQAMFKAAGESTASQIDKLIATAQATVTKVVELIKSWLRIIPKLDRWFVEQEAKIKADRIIKMSKEQNLH